MRSWQGIAALCRKARPKQSALRAKGAAEMLYYLFFFALRRHFSPLNVFRYITVRTAVASLTALLLTLLLGPWVINRLRELQVKQYIREEGPKAHQKKAGTPTMGGVLIVAAIVIPTLLWADLRNPYVLLAVGGTLAFGAIGFIDDYNKVVRRRNLGLSARAKIPAASAHVRGRGHRFDQPSGAGNVFNAVERAVREEFASRSGNWTVTRPQLHLAAGISCLSFCFWFS